MRLEIAIIPASASKNMAILRMKDNTPLRISLSSNGQSLDKILGQAPLCHVALSVFDIVLDPL